MPPAFDLQGHRGARGLRPENTLPSFESALDHLVSSIETDVHLTRDGVPVLLHDPFLRDGTPVSSLTLAELRSHPTAEKTRAVPPTLADLFAFVDAYAGDPGKTPEQRDQARKVRFDLELKRTPFRPEHVGDDFAGEKPGLLERRLVEVVRAAGVVGRTAVRSFDHRAVRAVRELEPALRGGVLVADTAPVEPAELAARAGAEVYCPDYRFLDALQVRQCHAAGVRVLPWTVNEPADWERLLAWQVDGVTTDRPDLLAEFLRRRGVAWL